MSRTGRILASVSLGYLQMAVTTIVGLWFTPFVLHRIGQRDFGLWSAALPILGYVGLIDFGIIQLLQRDVAYALGAAGGDVARTEGLAERVGRTVRLVLLQLPLLAIAAVAAWFSLPGAWSQLRGPYAVLLVSFVVSFPLRVSHAVLIGLQDLAFVARLSLVSWAVGVGVSIALLLQGWGLYGLAISWAISQIGSGIAWYLRFRIRHPTVVPRRFPAFTKTELIDHLRKGFWVVGNQVSVGLLNGSDVIVIAAVLGPEAVVPFTLTDKLFTIFGNLPQTITESVQPALAELRASGERHRLTEICAAVTLAVLMVSGLVGVLTVVVDQGFVGWWVADRQFSGTKVAVLLAVALVFWHWYVATVYTLFAFGHERLITISTASTGIVTVAVTAMLLRPLGVAGAPVASILAFTLIGLPINLIAIARETQRSVFALPKAVMPWAWRFGLLLATAAVVGHVWPPRTFLTLAGASIAAVLAYGAVMLPIALREPLGTYVRPRLAGLRSRYARGR